MAKKTYLDAIGNLRNKNSSVAVPQSKPVPGKKMIKNNAGGYVFNVGKFHMLERFLILGTEGPSYYASERTRTYQNYNNILDCLNTDPIKTINMIVEVSDKGRASSNDHALFALALAASFYGGKDNGYVSRTKAMDVLPSVARIGTHLFTFVNFLSERRNFGRAVRKGISNWYLNRGVSSLGLQLAKYQQRNGWTHKDIIRLAHVATPNGAYQNALAWSLEKQYDFDNLPEMIKALEYLKIARNVEDVVSLIKEYNAPREIVPTQFLNEVPVWEAMLPHMGSEALIRNLGNMARYGVLDSRDNVSLICNRLNDDEWLSKNRIHPMKVLVGMFTYKQGHGVKGSGEWKPNRQIVSALEQAFYGTFKYVAPTGKRICYVLDVSSSMGGGWYASGKVCGLEGFTPLLAEAAMTLVLENSETNYETVGFATDIRPVNIVPSMSLEEAMREVTKHSMGGTDAARPFIWAKTRKKNFDAFVMMTDSESWAGYIHPYQALNDYRESVGHEVKLVTMAFVANESTIGDRTDKNALDVVGFDSNVPALISNFIS